MVHVLNDPWPWSGTLHGRPLTLTDLIERGTLTPQLVALLAWTIAHGASIFAAAGPQGAGKSTVANALLELLPDDAQVYVTSGPRDRLELPSKISSPTYLLVNELSAHMSVYLSGPAVQRAFALLKQGVRMFGTLHARTAAEAAAVLYAESNLRPAEVDTPFVFVVLAAHWRGQEIVRRVVELGFLSAQGELTQLAIPSFNGQVLQALADWSGIPTNDIESDLARRAAHWA
jgi:type IV secretory pathway ATPase VirB11/archaellum biosynthesis ATPase